MKKVVYKVAYPFCGDGGGAIGFQGATENWKGIMGRFKTIVGIDADPEACEDFRNLTGAPAVCMDLFEHRDYVAFHGKQPPPNWREATPEDIRRACGGVAPDMVFTSPPCKGFSGLLPEKSAKSEKYQALNNLTVRGIFLFLEAFRNDLPAMILLENVPRITTRGEKLLHTVKGMLQSYGYVFHEGNHDCGVIGGLAQHRRRYLLIARNPNKVTSFVYKPPEMRVRSIGEVIGPMPLPNDPSAGPMHRLSNLQWKTWVRLALIPAGGDWRDLEKIAPEEYRLEYIPRGGGSFGVQDWNEPGNTVTGNAKVNGSNAANIADPRLRERDNRHPGVYQVVKWDKPGPCVTGTRFGSGAPAISDPRTGFKDSTHGAIYRVSRWDEAANTVTGALRPNNGAITIADPRTPKWRNGWKCTGAVGRVNNWDSPTDTVIGHSNARGNGAANVADPRLGCKPRNGTMGIQAWDKPGNTVIGAGDIHSGSAAVADPRIPNDTESGVWVIIAEDGTWHRPLTTLELAALQGFPLTMSDGSPLVLAGKSDARWRERIGNAVPPPAAKAIAETILRALLPSIEGAWVMGSTDIWVMPSENQEEVRAEDESRTN
ncbi:MAG: DNA cytosine methyltransferase [Thermincolia bacterium]